MAFDLPRTLTLPSGMRVTLERAGRTGRERRPRPPATGDALFADVLALFDGEVRIEGRDGDAVDARDLPLADFHVVRAVLTKAGLVGEEAITIDCHNCEAPITLRPCDGLEAGPWEDAEADDPELDRTLPLGTPIDVSPIALGRVRVAHTVTLAPRRVREALPLFEALGRGPLAIDEALVTAMGVSALGSITEPARIARALATCDDAAFGVVTNAFLDAHYPPRLACDVFCPKCGARNTVDAPALREFDREPAPESASASGRAIPAARTDEGHAGRSPLPPIEEFVEIAHRIADPLLDAIPGDEVELVVDDGVPAVDDGGEPLLGSYVPPPPRDAPVPMRPPTVTVYYRTFAAIERDEGPFDWEEELRETIEHELEHHVFFLRGHDPMDEEEHEEIDREALRVVGKTQATRRTLAVFGSSIRDFFVRAWPLVLIGAAVLALTLAEDRCAR